VPRGSIAALGFDYFQVGYTAGLKAVEILKNGKKPGDVPSSLTQKLMLVVNPKAAKAQGLMLDPKYVKKADQVIK
jgi:putative ABC transport system substrate-binding protein